MFQTVSKIALYCYINASLKMIISLVLTICFYNNAQTIAFFLFVIGNILSYGMSIYIAKHKSHNSSALIINFIADQMLFISAGLCILVAYSQKFLLSLHFMIFIELLALCVKLYLYSSNIQINLSYYSIQSLVVKTVLFTVLFYGIISPNILKLNFLNSFYLNNVSFNLGAPILLSTTSLIELTTHIIRRQSAAYRNF